MILVVPQFLHLNNDIQGFHYFKYFMYFYLFFITSYIYIYIYYSCLENFVLLFIIPDHDHTFKRFILLQLLSVRQSKKEWDHIPKKKSRFQAHLLNLGLHNIKETPMGIQHFCWYTRHNMRNSDFTLS